jgi:hypothetical protein
MTKTTLTDPQMRLLEKPTLTCRDVRSLFGDYVDSELTSTLSERVNDHVCECKKCQEFESSYRLVIQLAKEISPPEKISSRVEDRLLSTLRNRLGY